MSYMTKRIFKIDTNKLKRLVTKCSKASGKPKLFIFLDMAYCVFKYQAGYVDYDAYAMYNLNAKERATIMTRGKNDELVKELNPKEYWHVFDNKDEFNDMFKNYLNRKYFMIKNPDTDYENFTKFIKNFKEVIVKPINQSCGVGVSKIKVPKDLKKLYNKLIKDNTPLIEEIATQHKDISKLHPTSINTVRLVTIRNKYKVTSIVAAFIRIGTEHRVVDNFNNGGLCCPIDIETGKISAPAVDKDGKVYEIHPTTNIKLVDYQIPMWHEIKQFVIKASHVYPKLGYIGWDVCVGEKKPSLIEGNQYPGHDLYQLPIHRKGNIGVIPTFEKALNRKK